MRDLPPIKRSAAARLLNEVAVRGAFRLPRCVDCARFCWPVHEICPHCLGDIALAEAPRGATLVSVTPVLAPVAAYFRDPRITWHVGLVEMEAGPPAVIFVHPDARSGDPLTLSLLLDRAGQAVLYGSPGKADPAADPQWRELTLSPVSRDIPPG